MVGLFSWGTALTVATCVSRVTAQDAASITCNGQPYTYNQLAGYGFVSGDAVDKFGDTINIGSSITFASWRKNGQQYEGKMYGLPDRGWNGNGTVNFVPRIHEFQVTFTPKQDSDAQPYNPNVAITYRDTILLKGPDGLLATSLDPDPEGALEYPGFPSLPVATYSGDGFGSGDNTPHKAVAIDTEALVLDPAGGFRISDEYGPYMYKFDQSGRMISATAPPDAILALRGGKVSFSSNGPPIFDRERKIVPPDPEHGRANNQGLEGITMSPDGTSLFTLMQSATRQDGGQKPSSRRHARLLHYTVSKGHQSCNQQCARRCTRRCKRNNPPPGMEYVGEYVVPLPTFNDTNGNQLVAAQSEIHFLSDTQFLVLPRDSGRGRGYPDSQSLYRHVDIFDISSATNVKGSNHDSFSGSIASIDGVLNADITPATFCPFIDINNNDQLKRFGLHNGGPLDLGLLNEKWESLALVPVDQSDKKGHQGEEYFLFVASDNDFMTQNGFMNFGKTPFQDKLGVTLHSQVLAFRITLPKGSRPLAT